MKTYSVEFRKQNYPRFRLKKTPKKGFSFFKNATLKRHILSHVDRNSGLAVCSEFEVISFPIYLFFLALTVRLK
jgi:hypothetical protein